MPKRPKRYTKHFEICDNVLRNLNNDGMQSVYLPNHLKLESRAEIEAARNTLISQGYAIKSSNPLETTITGEGILFILDGGYKTQFRKERAKEVTQSLLLYATFSVALLGAVAPWVQWIYDSKTEKNTERIVQTNKRLSDMESQIRQLKAHVPGSRSNPVGRIDTAKR